MTNESMTARVEVYALAADEGGLWSLGGLKTIRPDIPIPADSEPHAEVELAMRRFGLVLEDDEKTGARADVLALHSTSWRAEGQSIILTYVAVAMLGCPARERFPEALPVTLEVAAKVGKPIPHHPADAPTPRYIDVLMHAIRHLRYLIDHDAPFAAVLTDDWRRALEPLKEIVAGMYSDPYTDLDEADTLATIGGPRVSQRAA